tara:strand:+ start:977 stop:1441 length:465 start_codon:yes stop_codon:yes gene_type:complete
MVSRKENKMNLLQTLWSWLNSLFGKAPALVEEDCCAEDCCEETECGPDDDCCEEAECCEPPPEPIIEIHVKEEPTPVVVEEVEEPVVSAPVGELLREILLSEGISETVIEKYEIVKTFEGWYAGAVDEASVRESIKEFKTSQGGVIKAKLSRVQ